VLIACRWNPQDHAYNQDCHQVPAPKL
jgi:hypothetical protein